MDYGHNDLTKKHSETGLELIIEEYYNSQYNTVRTLITLIYVNQMPWLFTIDDEVHFPFQA